MRIHATLILVLLACFLGGASVSSSARAEPDHVREGIASTGLCGLVNTAYPTCPENWGVAANAGYGFTEGLAPNDGSHQRLMGSLGGGVVPLPWLSVALRLDGRIDIHPRDARGKDLTGTGDPRLFLRGGYNLKRDASIGGEAVLWFPGNAAPSYEPKATTIDLKALAAWTPKKRPFALLGHVGYRLDQTANSAPDLRRLRQGDRSALGLSDSDALLIAVGASTRALVRNSELFVELSLDYLLGDRAPSFSGSPMRAIVGGRYFLLNGLQAELSAVFSLSSRPSIAPTSPLAPIEPRFGLVAGLRYGRALHPAPLPSAEQKPDEQVGNEPTAVQTSRVLGRLVDDQGGPLPDARVVLTIPPETQLRETVTDGEGRYRFESVPVGDATLEASAVGFQTQQWMLEVRPNMRPDADRALVRKSDTGTLRLLTRTFSSEPLAASIIVRDARGRKVTSGKGDEKGLYELDLPPGRYAVMISAPGYRTLRREVEIERYGVAILNVDMREGQ